MSCISQTEISNGGNEGVFKKEVIFGPCPNIISKPLPYLEFLIETKLIKSPSTAFNPIMEVVKYSFTLKESKDSFSIMYNVTITNTPIFVPNGGKQDFIGVTTQQVIYDNESYSGPYEIYSRNKEFKKIYQNDKYVEFARGLDINYGEHHFVFNIYTLTENDSNNKLVVLRTEVSETQNLPFSTTGSPNVSLRKMLSNSISVPQINILGQTLIDGSDIGEVLFDIKDKYCYKQNKSKSNNGVCKIEEIKLDELILTHFEKPCVKIVSIVIGTKENLRQKIGDIWNYSTDDFNVFFEDFLEYSMLRYILSKILYGDFNVNYLLRKYYEKFLLDLGKSRFCNFLTFFKDPKYSKMYTFFKK